MKKIKIVADSSSDILEISGIDYAYASLKIMEIFIGNNC